MTLSLVYKGLNYPAFYNGGYTDANSLDTLVTTGANSVAVGDDFGIDTTNSAVYDDLHRTDTLDALGNTIKQAESLGLTVMVRPQIDFLTADGSYAGVWRDTYVPTDPAAFFASYQKMIVGQAEIAEKDGAQMLDIGSELDQLTGPAYKSYWTSIISAVRAVYHGNITYSANWHDDISPWAYGAPVGTGDIATQISFWSQLDFIGIDQYAPISDTANPTLQDLIDGWTKRPTDGYTASVTGGLSLIQYYEKISAEIGKPLLFTEIGYQNSPDAAKNVVYPSQTVSSADQGEANQVQALAYTAFFDAWEQSGNDALQGTYFWYWNPSTQSETQSTTPTFSPQSLPAQQALTAAYSSTDTGPVADMACYVRGTAIATPSGPRAIESLRAGDLVLTASGRARAVTWMGSRALDIARHPKPQDVWPVRVNAHALGQDLPKRDLWLSPGHNIVMDGVLMPIIALCNGRTITQVQTPWVDYWHVELDAHDIILAEGLAAESYLDTGNRTAFINGGDFIEQHPDFKPRHAGQTCLPLISEGPVIHRAKSALLRNLAECGHVLTNDPDLHIIADQKRFDLVHLADRRIGVLLPGHRQAITLRSRSFIPADIEPAETERRQLGVCIAGLWVDGSNRLFEAQTKNGWHGLEQDSGGRHQRWTNGRGRLPAGARMIVIDLVATGRYWLDPVSEPVGQTTTRRFL